MKKNIFLFSSFVLLSGVAFAQTKKEPSLFPELDFGVIQSEAEDDDIASTKVEKLLDEQAEIQEDGGESLAILEDIQEDVDPELQQKEENPQEPELSAEQDENQEVQTTPDQEMLSDEEESEEEKKYIFTALNDIKSYPATIKAVSYCSGYYVLFNDTKGLVQEISGTLGIGGQTKDFKFENVQSGASVGWPLQIVGAACDSMLQIPDIQINVCKFERMSEKKCRERFVFVPIASS